MFTSYKNGGFAIKFDNNIVVSIQFSDSHYCDNPTVQLSNMVFSESAELGIYYNSKPRVWLTRRFAAAVLAETFTDDVRGFITPEIAAKAVLWASQQGGNY